ncbi:hypothetical protein HY091_01095 [Candidatus Kaiserbacteria bacterium]|nr:hypothetical protein [Candidatus Kaiserbacteria bacterium]
MPGKSICARLKLSSTMHTNDAEQIWQEYVDRELAVIAHVLTELGFELEVEQPHLFGERYLMRAVTTVSGRKLILLGHRREDGKRVVIKATSDAGGIRELEHERTCRAVLQRINFAYQTFLSPEEILFTKRGPYTLSIQAFIEQERPFLGRPLEEQFALALSAFKAQEGAHATTYGHERIIRNTFGARDAAGYLAAFRQFQKEILKRIPDEALRALLEKSVELLEASREIIEQYGGFLTHTDFVPHNFRVVGHDIYLLDYSSLRFGNKYEGWARFLNFMALYNPPLQQALMDYVRLNRTPEESLALKLMRIYRLGEIISYYANIIEKCSGNLRILNQERVRFWTHVLAAVLDDRQPAPAVLEEYKKKRDQLRSAEEKRRQKDLH